MGVDPEVLSALPAHVRALLSPGAYDHAMQDVELIQTHVSYVILAGDHAYKLKKAVDLGFLDFTSLEQRRHYCEEEVRLNSRTCASLYHGVEAVCRDKGRYRIGGQGEVVDYAVHMRRLPADRMLSSLLEAGAVSNDVIGRLVWKLAQFHASADGGPRVRAAGGFEALSRNWAANLEELRPFVGRTLPLEDLEAIRTFGLGFLERYRPVLRARETEGRIRECHGDLRADAICLDAASGDACIFDCLEFSESLRCSDTGLDIAFLAMDVERRGHREVSDMFLSLYTAACGDKSLGLVSSFYRCYRALIRGKIAGILLDQAGIAAAQRREAEAESRLHFNLARSYARQNLKPAVVLVMGLSGTGKSLLAGALAHRVGASLLSTDIVRKELAGVGPARRPPSAPGAALYAPDITSRVYSEMVRQAGSFLAGGHAVVLDGTYLTRPQRQAVFELAERRDVPLLLVECQAPDEVIRLRQGKRGAEPWTASDATWEVYLSQKAVYEPPREVPAERSLVVDSTQDLGTEIEAVLGWLAAI